MPDGTYWFPVVDVCKKLLKRGCIRQTGCTADGAPTYVLP